MTELALEWPAIRDLHVLDVRLELVDQVSDRNAIVGTCCVVERIRELGDRVVAVIVRAAFEAARSGTDAIERAGFARVTRGAELVSRRGEEPGDPAREPRISDDHRKP